MIAINQWRHGPNQIVIIFHRRQPADRPHNPLLALQTQGRFGGLFIAWHKTPGIHAITNGRDFSIGNADIAH